MANTTWSEIITNHALVYIDDLRLQEELSGNPAIFLRKMSFWLNEAIPMLSRPPELKIMLQSGATQPVYDDAEWTSTPSSTQSETQVQTQKIGYEFCSVSQRMVDASGNVELIPYCEATYNKSSGVVTFPVQKSSGIEYSIDFYTDGVFGFELTATQKRLLGLAVSIIWDTRFQRDWLKITPKLHDSSYSVVNENTTMRESTDRYIRNLEKFNDEIRKYEQDCAYMKVVKPRLTGVGKYLI